MRLEWPPVVRVFYIHLHFRNNQSYQSSGMQLRCMKHFLFGKFYCFSRFDFPFPSLKGNFVQWQADTPLMEAGLTSTMAVGPGSSARI